MWAIMCVCRHVCHMQARSCLSTGWALNRCFAWFFGTVAVLAQGGGGVRENRQDTQLDSNLCTFIAEVGPYRMPWSCLSCRGVAEYQAASSLVAAEDSVPPSL